MCPCSGRDSQEPFGRHRAHTRRYITSTPYVIVRWRQALEAARKPIGVAIRKADPCRRHCGAQLFFDGESRGICCKSGKSFLPRLPTLIPALHELYTSAEPSAQLFRKESRVYNCRCDFASMNMKWGTQEHVWR